MDKGTIVQLKNIGLAISHNHPLLQKYNPLKTYGKIVEINVSKIISILSDKRKIGGDGSRPINDNFELAKKRFFKSRMNADCIVEWDNGMRNSYKFRDLMPVH